MLRDVTIGQYYPVESKIHRLDPRVKFISTLLFIISLFFVPKNHIEVYGIVLLFLGTVIRISKVPLRYMLRGLRGIFIIILFTVFLNVFFTKGETVLFQFYALTVTLEGVYTASFMAVRLILLIVGSSLLTLTTSPIQLTDAIEFLLKPFRKIGVPAHEIALMMTIALRFIPTLIDETDKIMKAQTARGADFDTGGLLKKAKSLIPLLVPLFVSAFRRADELAVAMEARCYNGDKNRTRMKQMRVTKNDTFGIVCILGYFLLIIAIFVMTMLTS